MEKRVFYPQTAEVEGLLQSAETLFERIRRYL